MLVAEDSKGFFHCRGLLLVLACSVGTQLNASGSMPVVR